MVTMEALDRSLAQRVEALQRANDVRSARAELKRAVRAGAVDAAAVLADPPQHARTMKVSALLLATPRLGPVAVNHILMSARASHAKTIGGLSERQRGELVRLLRRWYS